MDELSTQIDINMNQIRKQWKDVGNFVERKVILNGVEGPIPCYLLFVEGTADTDAISHYILSPLLKVLDHPVEIRNIEDFIYRNTAISHMSSGMEFKEVNEFLSNGYTVLLIDGYTKFFAFNTIKFAGRSVSTPESQLSALGSNEGFVEDFQTNISLLRRILRTSRFRTKLFSVGNVVHRQVVVCWLEGRAQKKVLRELFRRLGKVEVESFHSTSELMDLMCGAESPWIPLYSERERPDAVSGAIVDGQIAIVVDGNPYVAIVPINLYQKTHASDDNYFKAPFYYIRLLRFVAINIGILLPGVYIAVLTFHSEILPSDLLMNLIGQAQNRPFPLFVEMLLLVFFLHVLVDAAFRLPGNMSFVVSLVGAYLVGDTLVQAGIVETSSVIIMAITFVCSLIVPDYGNTLAIRVPMFLFLIAGSISGLFGIILGIYFMYSHISSLKSFGEPLIAPLFPDTVKDFKDSVFRFSQRSILVGEHNFHVEAKEENEENEKR